MKIITIWHTVLGISSSGVCGCVVCVLGVWGWRQAINRLKRNILFWRKMVLTTRKKWSGLGQSLTLIGYSSGLPDIYEYRHPLRFTTPTYTCRERSVSGLQAHKQTHSQWYQRFKPFTKTLRMWYAKIGYKTNPPNKPDIPTNVSHIFITFIIFCGIIR